MIPSHTQRWSDRAAGTLPPRSLPKKKPAAKKKQGCKRKKFLLTKVYRRPPHAEGLRISRRRGGNDLGEVPTEGVIKRKWSRRRTGDLESPTLSQAARS